MHPTQDAKVIIRHCDAYDPERIRGIVRDALEELNLRPFGRTLVKPNLVGTGELFEHAFTRPEVVEGVLLALRDRDDGRMRELAVGERCGITIPTRTAYDGANYDPMLERLGVRRYCFEEETQVEIPLSHEGRLRDFIFTPEPVARADFFVNCPKFKAHPWTTVTFSLKNYIGIQDDRHRLIDHDHRLDEKVADLQHVLQPQLICIDAIIGGEGCTMLTPKPRSLNLLILGNNQVAFDAVCCRILGLDPASVNHIRLAHEQGFGPLDLGRISITGDVTLEEAQKRAEGFEVGLVRVEKFFEGTNITAYAGPPPEPERTDYCWGGCPGSIEEATEILRRFDEECDAKMPRTHVVFGAYAGPIDAAPDETVIFMGDCACWTGEIGGKLVQISSVYKDRGTKDPHTIKHQDVYAKLAAVTARFTVTGRKQRVLRFTGCPLSVAEQIMILCTVGGLKNPIFDPRYAFRFNKGYLAWKGVVATRRLKGEPYQRPGPCHRGAAQPETAGGEPGE